MAKNKRNGKEFKIPKDAEKMAHLSFKKFKKENDDIYESKKEMKEAYYGEIVDLLPESILLIVRYGHLSPVIDTKNKIFKKIADPKFVKYLTKQIKNEDLVFDNMDLLPNIIWIMLKDVKKQQEEAAKEENATNAEAEVEFDLSDLIDLSRLILKKKLKKCKKAEIPEDVAFDILSLIPNPNILKKSPYYHIREFFTVLYHHAADKEINFKDIIKVIFKDNKEYISYIITFALLERKEKITNFNDGQKKLFNDITEFVFKTMEEMKKNEIHSILKAYVDSRVKDDQQNKDTNRRYYISSLPEADYPKILKSVNKIIENDEKLKKYF